MAASAPPSVELAYQQLLQGFKAVGMADVDPVKAPWSELEKGIARLLGGALQMDRPDHQAVALGISAIFGKKLAEEDGGFWAQNRESPDGLIMGFPDAIVMLSPFGAAMDALSRASLKQLEDIQKEVRAALGRARLSLAGGPQAKLGPDEYERLFDPAFVQFVVLDEAKLKEAWEQPISGMTRNVRDALDRTGSQLPPEVKKQVESQLLGALSSFDQQKPLLQQLQGAGRFVELAAHLNATNEVTPPAPEEFWAAVALPLLFVGQPQTFPPFDDDEREAVKQGIDPLFLYLDVIPYQFPTEDEGLLGVFGQDDIQLPHPALAAIAPLRLLAVKLDRLAPALEKFDAAQSKAAFARFVEYVKAQTGTALPTAQSEAVMAQAFALIAEFKKVWDARGKGKPALRRLTEAEAAGEQALAVIRKSLHGPRIILA